MDPGPSIGAYHIVYRDFEGDVSARDITIRNVRRVDGDLEVKAWCHVRHDERTFLASRILEITDLSSGQANRDSSAVLGPMAADQEVPVRAPGRRPPRSALVAGLLIATGVVGAVVMLAFVQPSAPNLSPAARSSARPAPPPQSVAGVQPTPVAAATTVAVAARAAAAPVVASAASADPPQRPARSHRLRRHVSHPAPQTPDTDPPF